MEPCTDAQIRELLSQYAALEHALGSEFGQRPLVTPNEESFPDAFHPDEKGANVLMRRMQHHAGMLDIPVALRVTEDPTLPSAGGSCGTGACAPATTPAQGPRILDAGEGWVVNASRAELTHAVAMTTLFSRCLAAIFVEETVTDRSVLRSPLERMLDVVAVRLGFGPLLLEGSHIYSKSCGGPSIAQLTQLQPTELGFLTAVFAAHQRHKLKRAKKSLSTTQRTALGFAEDWLRSNAALVSRLARAPELLVDGNFELAAPRPALFGWLSSKPSDPELDALLAAEAPRKLVTQHTDTRDDDGLRKLVEDALREG